MPTCDTLICVATFNEGDTIGPLIDAILGLGVSADIAVIDDASADRTRAEVDIRAASDRRVSLLARPCKLGVGSAHRLAWLHARALGYARIVTLDADFSHDPGDIPRLLAMLDRGAEVAVGSRFMPGGKLDYRGFRRIISGGANLLARRMLRIKLVEYTTSLRAARLDRVPAGLVETVDHEGYSFFLACIVRMVRAGIDVVEIPIHFHERRRGQSKLPPSEIVKGALTLFRLALRGTQDEKFSALANGEAVCRQCHNAYRVPSPRGPRCLMCNGA